MIRRALFFPSSAYLENRWWHRLALVFFWAWLIFLVGLAFNWLVAAPYDDCLHIKYIALRDGSSFDCGSNPIDYALANLASEGLASVLVGAAFSSFGLYIFALAPTVLYRLILFVAKGKAWQQDGNAA